MEKRPFSPQPSAADDNVAAGRLGDYAVRRQREEWRSRAARPKSIRDVIADLMNRRGYGQSLTRARLDQAWQQTVAEVFPQAAGVTALAHLRRGQLRIVVVHSALAQEMLFYKQQFIAHLRQALPDESITDLRFQVGPVERNGES